MPRELLLQLLRELYPTVTQEDEEGEAGGGGSAAGAAAGAAGTGEAEEEDGQPENVRKLLEKLRTAERRLKAVEGLDPKVYREATSKVEQLERELREREALTAAERQRLEQKANDGILAAKKEAEAERAARVELQTRTLAKAAFELAKGQDGADDDGRTYFDGFMSLMGKHLRLDDNGALYVVDAQGDPVQSPDGKGRISPAEWMKSVADKSPVVGTFFKSQFGTGSGMQSSRGVATRGLPALKDLTPGQRRDLAWGEPA